MNTRGIEEFFSFDDKKSKILIALVLYPLSVIYAKYAYAPSDDAYIFLVYVRNFLEGNGLTYNGSFVEGFSSVLWVAILSVLGLLRIPLPLLAETLSLLTGLFALLTTYTLARSLKLDKYWALIPAIFLAATGDFAHYMSVGLEQVLFTGFVSLTVALTISKKPQELLRSFYYPILLALMILVRPEGVLISALLLAVLAVLTKSISLPIRCGLILSLILVPIIFLKWMYYGDWLPNTYYAKSNAGLSNVGWGLTYLANSLWRYGIILVAAASIIFQALLSKNSNVFQNKIWILVFISSIWLLNVIQFGGDSLGGGRMLLPALPLIYVALVKMAHNLALKPKLAIIASTVICLGLVLSYVFDTKVKTYRHVWRKTYVKLKEAGIYMRNNFPQGTLVALNPAGVMPFYSKLPTIDMHGLNDFHIAHYGKRDRTVPIGHQAGDGAYVLSKQPGIILLGILHKEPHHRFRPLSDREMWSSDEFHEKYKLEEWPGIGFAYVKKDEYSQSKPKTDEVIQVNY